MTRPPPIRCKHTPPGDVTPPVGTLLRQAAGAVVLYVGDVSTHPALDVAQLAEQLADTTSVLLVGAAGRTLKAQIFQLWTEQRRAVRQAAKPPAPVKADKQVCGQPKKDGTRCGLPAGWGADPGEPHCMHHGGSTSAADEQLRQAQQSAAAFARLHSKSKTSPLTLREQLDSVVALRGVLEWQQRPKRRRGS